MQRSGRSLRLQARALWGVLDAETMQRAPNLRPIRPWLGSPALSVGENRTSDPLERNTDTRQVRPVLISLPRAFRAQLAFTLSEPAVQPCIHPILRALSLPQTA